MADEKDYTLDDLRRQLDQLEGMEGAEPLKAGLADSFGSPEGEPPGEALRRVRRILDVMTAPERRDPDGIGPECRERIAADSGTTAEEVARFLGQFREVRRLMRQMAEMSVWKRFRRGTDLRGEPPPGEEE